MENPEFVKATHRVIRALRHGDWISLCRESTPIVTFVEYRRAYNNAYPSGLYDRVFGGLLFGRTSAKYAMNFQCSPVKTTAPLSREDGRIFRKFCALIDRNLSPVSAIDDIEISGDLVDDDEAQFLRGPAIRGRIASNAEWRIEMEQRDGKWKACRIIVASH